MMMDENTFTGTKITHGGARLLDHANRLVTEDQGRLAPDIPRHDVTGADTAGADADEEVVGSHFGASAFLDADIAEIVKTGNLHTHAENFVTRGESCQPAMRVRWAHRVDACAGDAW